MRGEGVVIIMVIPIRYGIEPVKEIWAGNYQCPQCGVVQSHHLYKLKRYVSFIIIPIVSITVKRGIVCDNCRGFHELSKSEYAQIKKNQELLFEQKKFPVDVIKQDYNPKELKMGRKICFLLFAVLLVLIMVLGIIGMISDAGYIDIISLIFTAAELVVVSLILFFAIKSVINARRKKALYDLVCSNSIDSI